ncbi:MAG: hypothetical protein QG597_845 [Actinomycetota bacterium]|nr:hypothetical protein [Actinomycetota bacterium]
MSDMMRRWNAPDSAGRLRGATLTGAVATLMVAGCGGSTAEIAPALSDSPTASSAATSEGPGSPSGRISQSTAADSPTPATSPATPDRVFYPVEPTPSAIYPVSETAAPAVGSRSYTITPDLPFVTLKSRTRNVDGSVTIRGAWTEPGTYAQSGDGSWTNVATGTVRGPSDAGGALLTSNYTLACSGEPSASAPDGPTTTAPASQALIGTMGFYVCGHCGAEATLTSRVREPIGAVSITAAWDLQSAREECKSTYSRTEAEIPACLATAKADPSRTYRAAADCSTGYLTTFDAERPPRTYRPISDNEWQQIDDGTIRGSSVAEGGDGMRQNFELACADESR